MSRLLIQEHPLQLLPSLAKTIGLNEAIILQQLHYWLVMKTQAGKSLGKTASGKRWIRNTVNEWQETNFPWWHINTIVRIFANLEKKGLILSRSDLNEAGYDRTKWYTIDYAKLESITPKQENPFNQNGEMEKTNMGVTIPETTQEKQQEIKEGNPADSFPYPENFPQEPTRRIVIETDSEVEKVFMDVTGMVCFPSTSRLEDIRRLRGLVSYYGDDATEHLKKFYNEWVSRGYSKLNTAWLDWAIADRIPTRKDPTKEPEKLSYQQELEKSGYKSIERNPQ